MDLRVGLIRGRIWVEVRFYQEVNQGKLDLKKHSQESDSDLGESAGVRLPLQCATVLPRCSKFVNTSRAPLKDRS